MKMGRLVAKLLFSFLIVEAAMAGVININTADVDTIVSNLNGVGEKKAQAIVDYREANNGFRDISELTAVKGIGEKLVERNKNNIRLDLESGH